MKIPKNIRINGVDYDVQEKSSLNDGSRVCYGRIDFENSIICLNPDGVSHQHMCQTFLHEVVHGILHHGNIKNFEGVDEEAMVDAIATGIYQVLQDNARSLFDIVPSE